MPFISIAVVLGWFVGAGYIPPGEACDCREVPREGCIPPLQIKTKVVVIPKTGNNAKFTGASRTPPPTKETATFPP